MNKLVLSLMITFVSISLLQAQVEDFYSNYDYDELSANNISLFAANNGMLHPQYPFGALWNYGASQTDIVFDQGIKIIGKVNGEFKASLVQWVSLYSPGPIINDDAAMNSTPEDSLRYRVYKISAGDDNSNPDYDEWPADLGAPVDDQNNPLLYGDQMLWTLYNGYDDNMPNRNSFGTQSVAVPKIPVEVHQNFYSRARNLTDEEDIFSNLVFMEWTIINKGSETIDSAFIGLWSDVDFNGGHDNKPAVDTTNQLAYCWSNSDLSSPLPAVGYTLLYGPIVPSQGDNAIFKGKPLADHKNLAINTFHPIFDDSPLAPPGDPIETMEEMWNVACGSQTDGNQYFDPVNQTATKFPYAGDPVTNDGWICDVNVAGGSGFEFFAGPVTMEPNDTQWVMVALVPGISGNALKSINVIRDKAALLQTLSYDTLAFGSGSYTVTSINNKNSELPKSIELNQNYPNPFNPSTNISFTIPTTSNVSLKIYDILGSEVATLLNEVVSAGNHEIKFNATGLSGGVYFYQLVSENQMLTKKLLLLK